MPVSWRYRGDSLRIYPYITLLGRNVRIRNSANYQAFNSPLRRGRHRHEVNSSCFYVSLQDARPVLSHIPRDPTRRIAFDGHHLAKATTLYEYDRRANATCGAAACLAAFNIFGDEWVALLNHRAGNEAGGLDHESGKNGVRHVF